MAQEIREVMTQDVVTLPKEASLVDASRAMRERDIGDVLVVDDERLAGIVTDRDIVVRAIADERSPADTTLGDLATDDVTTISPEDPVEDAIRIMRDQAVRRIPVVENDRPVGIVSIGARALGRDPGYAHADRNLAETAH